jgi:flavodoxin
MKSTIVYASRSGNTERIAREIASVLEARGAARTYEATEAVDHVADDFDLLIVGGPTEGHRATPAILAFLDALATRQLDGRAVAAFDTRVGWPRLLSGSAAAKIADELRQAGGRLVVPAESFIVSRTPELEPGEINRAATWAETLADEVAPRPLPV